MWRINNVVIKRVIRRKRRARETHETLIVFKNFYIVKARDIHTPFWNNLVEILISDVIPKG